MSKESAGQLSVTRMYKNNKTGEEHEDPPVNEVIQVRNFETQPAIVGVGFGLTINMGNFESCRLDVTVQMPCYAEEVSDCYEASRKWVEDRVKVELADIKGTKKKQLF